MTNKDLAAIINLNTNANSEETRMWVLIILAVVITESDDTWVVMKFLFWVITTLQVVVFWFSRKALKIITESITTEETEDEEQS